MEGFLFYLLFCCLLGVLNGMIGVSKGFGFGESFIVAFIFGIFGMMYTGFRKPDKHKVEIYKRAAIKAAANLAAQKNSEHKDYKLCPYCAEKVRYEAIKCKHCLSDLAIKIPAKID